MDALDGVNRNPSFVFYAEKKTSCREICYSREIIEDSYRTDIRFGIFPATNHPPRVRVTVTVTVVPRSCHRCRAVKASDAGRCHRAFGVRASASGPQPLFRSYRGGHGAYVPVANIFLSTGDTVYQRAVLPDTDTDTATKANDIVVDTGEPSPAPWLFVHRDLHTLHDEMAPVAQGVPKLFST